MLLRLGYTVVDRIGDACEAAVAPQPLARGEVGADRRADAVGAVTACACRARNLAAEDLLAERDLRFVAPGGGTSFSLPASG